MTGELRAGANFRRRLKAREHLLGTFLKMPTTHVIEILGSMGYDFVIVDQEHAAFGRMEIDTLILAGRAADIAVLVRVGDPTPGNLLSVLDCGATGVLVPHVDSVARATEIADSCRYSGGKRGFANTTRAGGFGDVPYKKHMEAQDNEVTVIAMIEDLAALDQVDAIAAVPGIHAFFIGRGDLTAALGLDSQTSPQTREAVERIMKAARAADMPTIVLPSNRQDATDMQSLGASGFVAGSDHGMLRRGAREALTEFASPLSR